MKSPKTKFPLFTQREDWWRNACLNYMPDNWELYSEGYELAVEILLEQSKVCEADMDPLIYPVVYLMYHFIELRLKSITRYAHKILGDKTDPPEHHKIYDIWKEVKKLLKQISPDEVQAKKQKIDKVEAIIETFSQVDPSATEFRYPEKKNKKGKSLNGIEKINYGRLEDWFEDLKEILTGFSDHFLEIIDCKNEIEHDFHP